MASSLVDVRHPDNGQVLPLTIITKTHSSQDEFRSNIVANMARRKRDPSIVPFLSAPGILHERRSADGKLKPLAIVGGGPSLNSQIGKVNQFENVMVCGSAHDHLISLGVVPNFAIAVDAKEDAVEYFTKPQDITSYLLASQCHPNLYDRLEGHKIAMWHFRGQCDDESVFEGEPQINWGCMIGVLAPQMALYLGFQELHFFGFDCSYLDNEHHAYDVGDYHRQVEEKRMVFSCNGRDFHSTMALVSQMEHLYDVFASADGQFMKGYVYGDGLWANNIKASPPEMRQWLEAI